MMKNMYKIKKLQSTNSSLLSIQVNVRVSVACSATLQTKHFIILFFIYRLQ